MSVSVTPDGSRAVSGSWDRTCRVWDLETGQCLQTLEGHTSWVASVSVTPDGSRAVSGSEDNTCRVWDLETGQCVAIYTDNSGIASLSAENADLHLVYGTEAGHVVALTALNFPGVTPTVTPARIWVFGDGVNNGRWADDVVTWCKWCGNRFRVSPTILGTIHSLTAHLSIGQSPCLELPREAWDEPRLLSECPHCHKPLRFNPFIVDNRGRY